MVISVATRHTENRTLARTAIRAALRELLAAYWDQPCGSVQFANHTGSALTLLSPKVAAGLSISHAPGCSVAAVHLHKAVGIDVVRVDAFSADGDNGAAPEWERLAHDYLGPVAHRQLAHTLPALRAPAFAQTWSELEAGMKCLGRGLTEWTPALGRALDGCTAMALELPDALRGAVVFI